MCYCENLNRDPRKASSSENGAVRQLAISEELEQRDHCFAMADQLKGVAGGVQNTVSSGAGKVSSTVQNPTSTSSDTNADWNVMSEDQKKQTFDSLPAEKKQNLSYYEWIAQGYHNQKENWMPWIEDVYLKWFTNDNKASYATKGKKCLHLRLEGP